jgi:hypothetical protein
MNAKLGEAADSKAAMPLRTLDQWVSQRLARTIG